MEEKCEHCGHVEEVDWVCGNCGAKGIKDEILLTTDNYLRCPECCSEDIEKKSEFYIKVMWREDFELEVLNRVKEFWFPYREEPYPDGYAGGWWGIVPPPGYPPYLPTYETTTGNTTKIPCSDECECKK